MDANAPPPLPERIAAVILAGGRATRMGGGDKCLIPVRGRTVICRILGVLQPQVEAVVLNANGEPGRFAGLGLPVVADGVAGQPGPLAGVLAGLDWAAGRGFGTVVTVPGDGPFLPPDLVSRLLGARDGGGMACAGSGGWRHPITAVWPVGCREELRRALAAGVRKVQGFTGAVPVAWWEVGAQDPFANLNAPGDIPD